MGFTNWFWDTIYWIFYGKSRPVLLVFKILKNSGVKIMVTLSENQKVKFTLVSLDSKGRPAPIDGVPVWTNSNPGVVDLALNTDQMSGEFYYLDGGSANIKATVDVRIGPEVKELTASVDISCLPPEAEIVNLVFDTPESI
jgi:hypothetical protein